MDQSKKVFSLFLIERKNMRLFLVTTLLLCSGAVGVAAVTKTFTRDYTYTAGEADSKITARSISLDQVKRILLEEIGVYLRSTLETEKKEVDTSYSEVTKEQLTSITAGITETKILDERWTGEKYYIKAEITVDADDVKEKLNRVLEDQDQTKNLEESQLRADSANAEIERLKKELAEAKSQNEKESLKKQYVEQTQTLDNVDASRSAHTALNSGNFDLAIAQFNAITVAQPHNARAYFNLGVAYAGKKDLSEAILMWKKALEINPKLSMAYVAIGRKCYESGNPDSAMIMFQKALNVNPNACGAYYGMGIIFYSAHHPKKAIKVLEHAIAINPHYAQAYFTLAKMYYKNGNKTRAQRLTRRAAQLGNVAAREYIAKSKE